MAKIKFYKNESEIFSQNFKELIPIEKRIQEEIVNREKNVFNSLNGVFKIQRSF